MADVFISYPREAEALTELFAGELVAGGFTVWWDRHTVGRVFREEIRRELHTAAAVVVIWTRHSLISSWVKKEASYAERKDKLINLHVPEIDPDEDIPWPFNEVTSEDFSRRSRIYDTIRNFRESNSASSLYARISGAQDEVALSELLREHPTQLDRIRARATDLGLICVHVGERNESTLRLLAPGQEFRDVDYAPKMTIVRSGKFEMGSPASERGSRKNERPVQEVSIAKPFAVSTFPITVREWNGSRSRGLRANELGGSETGAATHVNWIDATKYATWLSEVTGKSYRLLTEAEWEYACRADTKTPYSLGPEVDKFATVYDDRYAYRSAGSGVRKLGPPDVYRNERRNAFGIFDMHGLIWEWVQDDYHHSYHGAPPDGSAWVDKPSSKHKVIRGGCYASGPRHLRSARRARCDHLKPNEPWKIGFRVARNI